MQDEHDMNDVEEAGADLEAMAEAEEVLDKVADIPGVRQSLYIRMPKRDKTLIDVSVKKGEMRMIEDLADAQESGPSIRSSDALLEEQLLFLTSRVGLLPTLLTEGESVVSAFTDTLDKAMQNQDPETLQYLFWKTQQMSEIFTISKECADTILQLTSHIFEQRAG